MVCFPGLPQDHQTAHGSRYNKEAPGAQLLLERQRMHSGLQHNVHKLLRVQQARGGCSSDGTDIRKTVPHEGGEHAQR